MADIDVVKKSARAWLWIVILAALILVIWFAVMSAGPTS